MNKICICTHQPWWTYIFECCNLIFLVFLERRLFHMSYNVVHFISLPPGLYRCLQYLTPFLSVNLYVVCKVDTLHGCLYAQERYKLRKQRTDIYFIKNKFSEFGWCSPILCTFFTTGNVLLKHIEVLRLQVNNLIHPGHKTYKQKMKGVNTFHTEIWVFNYCLRLWYCKRNSSQKIYFFYGYLSWVRKI